MCRAVEVDATGDRRCHNERGLKLHNQLSATARAVALAKERNTTMDGKMDQVKGPIKKAAGALTDGEILKRKGKLDQVVGKVKETTAKVVEKMRNGLTGNTPPNRTKWKA
jgi:uncharacterized protein YjbJ (UPF0337 family)